MGHITLILNQYYFISNVTDKSQIPSEVNEFHTTLYTKPTTCGELQYANLGLFGHI